MNSFSQSRQNVLSNILQSIAKREGIENPEIEICEGSEKGEGYVGEKHLITLRGNKTVELFMKVVPSDEALREALDLRLIYLTEILFYKKIMPTLMDYQIMRNIPRPFESVIECVDTCSEMDNELLILRNIKSLGYQLWEKKNQINAEHVKFVFTEYGKFHGLSYGLKDRQPEVYNYLIGKFLVNPLKVFAAKMKHGFLKMADNAKALFDPIKDAKVYETYSAFVDNLLEYMDTATDIAEPYSVIIHGDCWSNNMMFKYENSNNECPSEMRLLDFQLMTEGSPVCDIASFLYSSAPKEIYNNLDEYLHVYYDSLSKTIRDLGSDPELIFTFEELENQWKKHSRFGFLMAILVLKMCVQEQSETVEISEALEETGGEDIVAAFTRPNLYDHLYYERLKSLIEHMVENKFI